MDFKTILFYAFAATSVLAALRVITARNPVHSALFLVLSFFSAAAIWMLLQAEFLAIVLVLVYVGAVMVLFLFVVMMIDVDTQKLRDGFWNYLPLAATVGSVIVLEMAVVIVHGFWMPQVPLEVSVGNIGGTKELGLLLYTHYVYAFEVVAVVLLVAIIASVVLTITKRKDTKYFSPGKATKVKRSDRVRIVNVLAQSDRVSIQNQPVCEGDSSGEKV